MTTQVTRKYSSRSQQTTLTAACTSGDSTFSVVAATTLLGGITIGSGQTFTVVIDPDTALEEIVDVTSVSSNILTVTRGVDSSTAQDHSAGAVIRHMVIGRDLREANTHEVATSGVHGLTGNVVGDTDTQVLTNKDLSSATNTLSTSVVTLTGTQTLSNKTLTNPTITNASETTPTINGATISGTWTSTATLTGGTLNPTTLQQNSVGVATLSDTQTLTNKTLTSPTINGGTRTGGTVSSATLTSNTLGSNLAAGGYVVTGLGAPVNNADSATKNYVDTSIANLIGSAPSTLNTLQKIDAAINNDASVYTTLVTQIGTKLNLTGGNLTGALDLGSNKITSLATPTVSTDAANKGYIDTIFGSTASAAASATAAATSATSAAASATAAATSAASSLISQTAAATSATSAAISATAAATSATSAAASATAAANSAATASTQATNASGSATAAATSASSAAVSATNAATSASSAATSASSAATSATSSAASAAAALTSANSASLSQTAAATSATSAAASATAAATSATSAAASATAASNSATNAATSASSSLATYNTYKTYYLGSFASAPTLDDQGNALINGATYFNSTTNTMYVYSTGTTTWSAISSTSAVTNVLGTAGNITSTGGSAPTINLATAGTAGTYGHPSTMTTDAYGRVTSVTAGTVTGSGNYVLQTNPTLTLPTIGNAVFGLTNVPVSGGTTNLSSSDNQQIYFTANGSNSSHTVVLPNTATLAVGEYFDLTNITHLGTNANVTVNLYGGTNLATLYPSQSVVATVLSTSSNTSGAWNLFYDGSSTATGTSAAVFSNGPTLVTPVLGAASGTSLALSFSGSSSSQGSLSVGGNINGGPDTGLIATFAGAQPTYAYTLVQNTTNGASSYASMTVANNDFSSYIDVGVNSSTYSYTSAGYVNNSFTQPKMNFIEATGGDLTIGTWSSGTALHFVVGGTSATADSMSISSSTVTVPSLTLSGSLTAASTSGTSGQLLQSTGTGVQWTTFSSAPWTTVSTSAATTMVSRYQYFVNTGSAVTMTLPSSANAGDEIRVFDSTNNAAANNITIAPNGLNIQGSVQNLVIDVSGGGATLLYTGSTYGWKVA